MTFLEGLLSFVSPCILPMLPVYLIYFAGEGGADAPGARRRTFLRALAFVLGFSAVFILLGTFAGVLGGALAAHRRAVSVVCGVTIVLFGLSFLGVVRLPLKGVTARPKITGVVSAFVFGIVFSLCLTPCVGAFLGAALMTAASEGGAARGAVLLAEYSAGLAIPFILSALAIDFLKGAFAALRSHLGAVTMASGALLVALGGCTAAEPFLAGREAPTAKVAEITSKKEETKMEITLNAANFEAEVLKADRPVIVDFWAPWCGPCRMLAPELESLAAEKGDAIRVGKVNVDDNPELCATYGIASIPAVFVFKNGKVTAQSVGFVRKADLAALLDR